MDVLFFLCGCYRVVRPRLTIYVCQESQQAREQKHENGDAAANTFFGQSIFCGLLLYYYYYSCLF